MRRIVMDGVYRRHFHSMIIEGLARVGVDVEPREIAAGNVDAKAVTFLEDVAGGIKLDRHRIDLARRHELLFCKRIAVPGADNAVSNVQVKPARPVLARWIHVEK